MHIRIIHFYRKTKPSKPASGGFEFRSLEPAKASKASKPSRGVKRAASKEKSRPSSKKPRTKEETKTKSKKSAAAAPKKRASKTDKGEERPAVSLTPHPTLATYLQLLQLKKRKDSLSAKSCLPLKTRRLYEWPIWWRTFCCTSSRSCKSLAMTVANCWMQVRPYIINIAPTQTPPMS